MIVSIIVFIVNKIIQKIKAKETSSLWNQENRNLEGNNMNRFGVKLILSIVSFLAVNIWLIGKGVAKGVADFFISATVEETILFIILQLLVVLIYFIYPLTVKKYKIIYWSVSEALVIITVLFWGIFIVGPIWLK